MEIRGCLAGYCVLRDIQSYPVSWEKGQGGLGMEARTAGLSGACGGAAHLQLQPHQGEVDVSERGSLHPQATEALRHECLQVGACLRSREH